MIDTTLQLERTVTIPASPAPSGIIQRAIRRVRLGIRMHHLLFLAFIIVAAVPIIVLALWEERTSYQHELDSVRERHLLVARNLTTSMSRYIRDVKAAFTVVFESGALDTPIPGLADLLTSLNVIHVCIVAPNGTIESWLRGLAPARASAFDPKLLVELKALATSANGEPALSHLQHNAAGRPVFYLAKALPNNRLGVGILSTDYLHNLRKCKR